MNRHSLWQAASAIASLTVFACTISLSLPLLTLTLEARGESSTIIGLLGALTGIGIIIGAPLAPAIATKWGAQNTLKIMLTVIGASFIAYKLFEDSLLAWFIIRFLSSVAGALVFTLSEATIAAASPAPRRGMILGVYAASFSAGFAVGPIILLAAGTSGWPPYLAAAALTALAVFITQLSGRSVLEEKDAIGFNLFSLLRRAPLPAACAFVVGATETSVYDLLPVYAKKLALDESAAVLLLTVFSVGAIILQAPLGAFLDRVGIRRGLIILSGSGGIAALFLPWMLISGTAGYLGLALWSGLMMTIYPAGLNEAARRFGTDELIAISALFSLLYGAGAFFGPILCGAMMDLTTNGMAWALAFFCFFLLLFVVFPARQKT